MAEQTQDQAAEQPRMRTGNVVGWFVLLIALLMALQPPHSRDMHALILSCFLVGACYIVGGIVGFLYYAGIRKAPYSHFFGLTTASVMLGLAALGPFSAGGHPTLDFSDVYRGPSSAPTEAANNASQVQFEAAYAEFFADPGKQYLLGAGIRDVFDGTAVDRVNSGLSPKAAFVEAERVSIEQLDAAINPSALAQLVSDQRYAQLALPGFRLRHKQRARELLAAGVEPRAALVQSADQVLVEINQLN
jgi:hypothetical protein